jgi:hypothetical protein
VHDRNFKSGFARDDTAMTQVQQLKKKKVIVDDNSGKVQIKKIVYVVHILLLLEKTDLQTETYL